MTDNLAFAAIVFVAALLQVTLVASLDVAGGAADVLLLALLSIALLRGAVTGAVAGFFGGLLIDIVTLDTLGVPALLYALAGYWTGRYGETTGRDRAHAPLLAIRSSRLRSPSPGSASTSFSGRTSRPGARLRDLLPRSPQPDPRRPVCSLVSRRAARPTHLTA